MFSDGTRKKLKDIIGGIVLEGQEDIAQQPEISYAAALAQVQRLKETSKVSQSSKKSK